MLGCVASFTLSFSASAFTVYDELLFINKPDLTPYGLKKNQIFYESDLFPLGQYSQPNEAAVRAAARRLVDSGYPTNEPVQLDIEFWEWDTHWATDAVAADAMNKLIQIIRWFKNEAPQYTKVGYYAAGPNRQYWPAQDPVASSPAFVKWQGSNDFLAPLIAETGALYPSLYTFYNDRAGWVKYAKANIAEAKRIGGGKPVYPFIWPRYHESGDMGQIYIDDEFWKLQLQTVKAAGADGVIIWGGCTRARTWTGNWPWWQATRDFLAAQTATTTAPKPPSTPTTTSSTPTTTTSSTPTTTTSSTPTTTTSSTPTTTTSSTPTTTTSSTPTTTTSSTPTTTTSSTPTTTTLRPRRRRRLRPRRRRRLRPRRRRRLRPRRRRRSSTPTTTTSSTPTTTTSSTPTTTSSATPATATKTATTAASTTSGWSWRRQLCAVSEALAVRLLGAAACRS